MTDMEKQAWTNLNDWLKANGFTINRSAADCLHREGIPSFNRIAVSPVRPPQGDAVVLVTPTTVSYYTVKDPVSENKWERIRHGGYTNPFELQDMLEEVTQERTGCWV